MNQKPKYEKPIAMDMGSLEPVHGATCLSGHGPAGPCVTNGNSADGCTGVGNDPNVIPYCRPGNIATAACEVSGSNAGQTCFTSGSSAGWSCIATGGTPTY